MSENKKSGGLGGKLIKGVLALVVLLVVVVFGGALALPSSYDFSRDVVIKADREDIHKDVGDVTKWQEWGPWKDEDPGMTWKTSEDHSKPGSWLSWEPTQFMSPPGRVEFTKANDHDGIEYKMQMNGKDFGSGAISYVAAPDDSTKVTWTWHVTLGYDPLNRWFLATSGGMMNDMFDKGLAKLKARHEAKK